MTTTLHAQNTTTDATQAAIRTIEIERDALSMLAHDLESRLAGHFRMAIQILLTTTQHDGRVIISGMGKSGHIGSKITATLASTGTPAYFVHPAEASHGDLGMITTRDCVLAISNSGETAELADVIGHCKRFTIPLMAITSRAESTLAKAATCALVLPAAAEACPLGMAPTTSTTLALALGDALAVALLEARGFTKSHFRDLHPGGKLGKVLMKVGDLMHTGAAMPLVQTGTTLDAALIEMSGKRLGCVGISNSNGTLAGMITDGDIRRTLKQYGSSLFTHSVDAIMTKQPTTTTADILAAEAVAVMNEKMITQLFVLDAQQKPVGVLHLHDCLKAGIA